MGDRGKKKKGAHQHDGKMQCCGVVMKAYYATNYEVRLKDIVAGARRKDVARDILWRMRVRSIFPGSCHDAKEPISTSGLGILTRPRSFRKLTTLLGPTT